MSEKISILIADDNVQFGNLLQEYISRVSDMDVAGIARDGLQAISMIKSLKPDVVLLDIIMPNLDGLGVLEKMSSVKSGNKPSFIVLTALGQDIFIQKAMALGAGYYIVKPFDMDVLVSRIREIYKYKCYTLFNHEKQLLKKKTFQDSHSFKHDMETLVTNLIRSVGVPPHVTGYQYIREAVIQVIKSPNLLYSMTKILYPSVAKKFNSTPQRVERAIRNAIDGAWKKGDLKYIESTLGYCPNKIRSKPSNSEFIALIADKARLSLGIE